MCVGEDVWDGVEVADGEAAAECLAFEGGGSEMVGEDRWILGVVYGGEVAESAVVLAAGGVGMGGLGWGGGWVGARDVVDGVKELWAGGGDGCDEFGVKVAIGGVVAAGDLGVVAVGVSGVEVVAPPSFAECGGALPALRRVANFSHQKSCGRKAANGLLFTPLQGTLQSQLRQPCS